MDHTVAWLRTLGDRISVFTQANLGPGSARNLGASQARGEYLAFLDSDDHWFPWTLQTYETIIRQSARPAFIAGKPLRFRTDAELLEAEELPLSIARFDDYLASGDAWRWWGVSSFVMQREAVLACGGFATENINGEDADLALKLGIAPGFVQIMEPVTFGYREHASNLTANLSKTVAGAWHKIRMEQAGRYPGGASRATERWRVLTRHLRPVILACLRTRRRAEAWNLYRSTFAWHWQLGRWKFLAGCFLQAIICRWRMLPTEPGPT
jgi:glycosyltransferase involved in cell wall biosynthesis